MTHIGTINVKNDGTAPTSPAVNRNAPTNNRAMPLTRLPCTPHLATKNFAKRVVTIIAIATVAKARLNSTSERPALPIMTSGAVEKNTKNVPMAVLNPSV
ncbi:hypothetical protein D3C80_1822670 [compost metagenome]